MTTGPLELDGGDWVPEACTLPTVEQPLRVAEFDKLFADGLLGLERRTPTELVLTLDAAKETTARDLAARETNCCSFFEFTFTTGSFLRLQVRVPPTHVDVLDALTARATAGLSALEFTDELLDAAADFVADLPYDLDRLAGGIG